MVSKSALEQAELMAEIKRQGDEQERKERNAEARRGLFMLLLAVIWGTIKLIFKLGKFAIDESKKYNRL